MSRVTAPIVERTRFSSAAPQAANAVQLQSQQQSTTRSPSPLPWDDPDSQSTANSNGATAQKRKRNEADEAGISQFSDVSAMPPPPKQSELHCLVV